MTPPPRTSAYAAAGVDIDAQEKGLARVKKLAKSTFTPGVLTEIGSFGGLFRPDLQGMKEPVLVASADGVGTDARAPQDPWSGCRRPAVLV